MIHNLTTILVPNLSKIIPLRQSLQLIPVLQERRVRSDALLTRFARAPAAGDDITGRGRVHHDIQVRDAQRREGVRVDGRRGGWIAVRLHGGDGAVQGPAQQQLRRGPGIVEDGVHHTGAGRALAGGIEEIVGVVAHVAEAGGGGILAGGEDDLVAVRAPLRGLGGYVGRQHLGEDGRGRVQRRLGHHEGSVGGEGAHAGAVFLQRRQRVGDVGLERDDEIGESGFDGVDLVEQPGHRCRLL